MILRHPNLTIIITIKNIAKQYPRVVSRRSVDNFELIIFKDC